MMQIIILLFSFHQAHAGHLFFTTDRGTDHTDHTLFTVVLPNADNVMTPRSRTCGPALMAVSSRVTGRWFPWLRLHSRGSLL